MLTSLPPLVLLLSGRKHWLGRKSVICLVFCTKTKQAQRKIKMACVVGRRLGTTVARRTAMLATVRFKDTLMADPIEHATGLEKRELLAKAAGNDNPFDMRVYKRGAGTKAQPNVIPSVFDKRMIGCICEEDATVINYMWLHMGEPKRCECGYWFKLVEAKPV